MNEDALIPTPGTFSKEWVGGKKGPKEETIDSGNESGRGITLGTLGNWRVGVRNVLVALTPLYHL